MDLRRLGISALVVALCLGLLPFLFASQKTAVQTLQYEEDHDSWLEQPRIQRFSVFEDVRIELGKSSKRTLKEQFNSAREALPWPTSHIVRTLRLAVLAERDPVRAIEMGLQARDEELVEDLIELLPVEKAIEILDQTDNESLAWEVHTAAISLLVLNDFERAWNHFLIAPYPVQDSICQPVFEELTLRSPARAILEFNRLEAPGFQRTDAFWGMRDGLKKLPVGWTVHVLLDLPVDLNRREDLVKALEQREKEFADPVIIAWVAQGCPAERSDLVRERLAVLLPEAKPEKVNDNLPSGPLALLLTNSDYSMVEFQRGLVLQLRHAKVADLRALFQESREMIRVGGVKAKWIQEYAQPLLISRWATLEPEECWEKGLALLEVDPESSRKLLTQTALQGSIHQRADCLRRLKILRDDLSDSPKVWTQVATKFFGGVTLIDPAWALDHVWEWKINHIPGVAMKQLVMVSPEEAMARFVELRPDQQQLAVNGLMSGQFEKLGLEKALDGLEALDGHVRMMAETDLGGVWAAEDPVGAAAWVLSLGESAHRQNLIEQTAHHWAATDSSVALSWIVREITEPEKAGKFIDRWFMDAVLFQVPHHKAAACFLEIPKPYRSENQIYNLISNWARVDPEDSWKWISSQRSQPNWKRWLRAYLSVRAYQDLAGTIEWEKRETDKLIRAQLRQEIELEWEDQRRGKPEWIDDNGATTE